LSFRYSVAEPIRSCRAVRVWLPPFSFSAAMMYSFSTFVERPHRSRGGLERWQRLADLGGEVLELHAAAARERDRALQITAP
jgi:hypothetical protein